MLKIDKVASDDFCLKKEKGKFKFIKESDKDVS
jgi:hypothetical protein